MTLTLPNEDFDNSCNDLLCSEDASELAADSHFSATAELPEDAGESIPEFIEGEAAGLYRPAPFRSNSLDPAARRDAVSWILKVQTFCGFHDLTAYLAVNYMDRFLASHHLPQNVWALQLLSVACLSLAAKMEEILVPTLLDLQVGGSNFVFEPKTILRMELCVLSALGWRLQSVTPFTSIDFFASKFDPSGKCAGYLVSCASQIILATMRDISFLGQCPSSVAAVAITVAAQDIQDLAFSTTRSAISWCIGLTEDSISSCYRVMQRVAAGATARKPQKMSISRTRETTLVNFGSSAAPAPFPPSKRRKMNNNCLQADGDKDTKERVMEVGGLERLTS